MMRSALMVLTGLFIGFICGQRAQLVGIGTRLDARAAHAQDAAPVSLSQPAVSAGGAVDMAALLRRLDGIAASCAASSASSPQPAPVAIAPVTSGAATQKDDEDARVEAEDTLDAAFARGTWTDADAQRFRVQSVRLSDSQREELIASLVSAVNAQKLRVSAHGAAW
jgi:hypothetical protein